MENVKKTIMNLSIILSTMFLINVSTAHCADIDAWFESGTTKVRQSSTVKSQSAFSISAAQNEFEPFQLVLKKNSTRISNIDVSISDFTGAGTISNTNVTIFKVGYLNISTLSTIEGQLGEWPDSLCPKVDSYFHETRNCFPLNIPSGRVQPIWFDVFVPANATPGKYQATVTVIDNGVSVFTGAVNLNVWGFSLPATSSVPTSFTLNMDPTWQGHSGLSWPTGSIGFISNLMRTYIQAGLKHRLTLTPYPISWGAWNGTDYASVDATYFQQSLNGFFGVGDPGVEYGQAKVTALTQSFSLLYNKYAISQGLCTNGTIQPPAAMLFETRKRAERLAAVLTTEQKAAMMVLAIDEPGGGEVGCGAKNPTLDFNSSKAMATEIKAAGLKTFITASWKPQLLNSSVTPGTNDYFDVWLPYLGSVVGRDWSGNLVNNRSLYDVDIASGKSLWWYQSCMTKGCGITGGASYNGNPQYMVEYSAMHNRIFPWMTFKYDVRGELYYATTATFKTNPWASILLYGGNGDGTFFYPGVPNTVTANLPGGGRGANTPSIGGTRHIPVESIRLKMIREGYEDYEYLKMLADLGDKNYAQSRVNDIVTSTYNFSKDENQLFSVREQLANRILSLIGGNSSSPPAPVKGFKQVK